MNPSRFADDALDLLALYQDVELEMIERIKRAISRGVDPLWADRKLSEMQKLRAEMEALVDALERESREEIDRLLELAAQTGRTAYADEFAAVMGYRPAVGGPWLSRTARIIEELNGRLSIVHRNILRSAMDDYRQIIGRSIARLSTGTITLQESIRMSLREFAARGITSFFDSNGRAWGMGEYAEMATRTGMMNAALDGYMADAEANGDDLVLISYHTGACPLCAPWQGAVLSLSGDRADECDGSLDEAEAAGLFHPNCLHSFTIYFPGITSRNMGQPQSAEADAEEYDARQYMRYCERNARKYLREYTALNGVDPSGAARARARLEDWDDRAKQTAARYRYTRYQRERIYGRADTPRRQRR